MGTNYFGKKIPTAESYEELKNAVLLSPISEALIIIECYEEKIHIGKSSAGWDFIFNWNGGKYYHTKLELLNWLETVYITDEYDRHITAGEFWSDVVINRKFNDKATQKHKSFHSASYLEVDGLEFLDSEFS